MFTGIIESLGRVVALRTPRQDAPTRLEIECGDLLEGLDSGASIAVNGCCLTLADRAASIAHFDVIPETLRMTNLGELRPDNGVNLERSLRASARIDGHFVQGHIDGVGIVQSVESNGPDYTLSISINEPLAGFIVRKGSIAIDGVSLTIVRRDPTRFSVALIPETLSRTTLGRRRAGDRVNIETDILARIVSERVDRVLAGRGEPGLTLETLREHGFAP